MPSLAYRVQAPNLLEQVAGEALLRTLLTRRGITDVSTFLHLSPQVIHDSFQLQHIDLGVALFAHHLRQGSPIGILIDADVDGVTSAAMMWRYIQSLTGHESQYFVHSGKQHGITPEILEQVLASGCRLLITPDAATNDVEACRQLQEAGIDVLILDHHQIERPNPYAIVINNQDTHYPNKTLVGAGVVYKFIDAFNRTHQVTMDLRPYLAMTALALVADMAWLGNPESRYLVLEGMKCFSHEAFLKALCEKQAYALNHKLTIDGVAWSISPLLNAVIRLGSVEDKQDLFKAFIGYEEAVVYKPRRSAKCPHPVEEIQTFQEAMARRCVSFKTKQSRETKKGMELLKQQIESEGLDQHKILIVRGDDLNPTFTGLVANRLADAYKRPTLVLRHQHPDQPFAGGSGRNYSKSSLKDFKGFLAESGLMEMIQGHTSSFGLKIDTANISQLIQYANTQLADMEIEDVYEVETEIPFRQLRSQDVLSVGQWDDFWGGGLTRPLFAITDIYLLSDDIQLVGEKKNIIRFQAKRGSETFTFVKFFANETLYNDLIHRAPHGLSSASGKRLKLTVVGEFKVNDYNGESYPQIEVVAVTSEEAPMTSYF